MIIMALQDQLGKMIGPLPMGAWLAVVGGGLGFALYYRNHQAVGPALDATGTDSGVGQGGIPAGYTYTGSDGTTGTNTPQGYADNDAWGTGAVNYANAHNL